MDPVRFDGLTRVLGQVGSRRGVVALLAALPLGSVLTSVGTDEAAAERPGDRLQQRNKQRNNNRNNDRNNNRNKNNNGKKKNKGGGVGGSQCGATGSFCAQDSDCCTNNCFDFACAERVTTCGQGSSATRCLPPAKGCAGDSCCNGSLACGDNCCLPPANQCNPQGACCAPNCAGRSCGPDGCGAGGTCGSCPASQTCNATTGTCQSNSTCSTQNCPAGCCDATGKCQTGNTAQACGADGAACAPCTGATPVCQNQQCVTNLNTFSCLCNNGARPSACRFEACSESSVKAICPNICKNGGGWASLGNVAGCQPNTCAQ